MKTNYDHFNWIMKTPLRLFKAQNSALLIIVIFSGIYLNFIPYDNEEMYFFSAKLSVERDWIEYPSDRIEVSGPKLIYNYLVGNILKVFSFETSAFILRLLLILMVSYGLNKLYRLLSFNNVQILFHLAFLFLPRQPLFGGCQIFMVADATTIASVVSIYGLYYLTNNKYINSILISVIITYIHPIIGLQFFITAYLTVLYQQYVRNVIGKRSILLFAIYVAAVLPYFYYLSDTIILSVNLKPDPNWIYTYFRHPHHTALFLSANYFYKTSFYGIMFSFFGLVFLMAFKIKLLAKNSVDNLLMFGIISLMLTLIAVPLVFVDKTGSILKYYLFRMSAISNLILTIYLIKWAYFRIISKYRNELDAILFLSIFSLMQGSLLNIYDSIIPQKNLSGLEDVCAYIKNTTQKSDVILNLSEEISVMRRSERPVFSEYKFVPANLNIIHDWYYRVLEQEKILADIKYLDQARAKYKIDYVLAPKLYESDQGMKLLYSNSDYYLYTLTSGKAP